MVTVSVTTSDRVRVGGLGGAAATGGVAQDNSEINTTRTVVIKRMCEDDENVRLVKWSIV